MSISAAYTRWAATYDSDRNLTRDLDELVTRQSLSGSRYTTIVELGCGTGKNTALLAQLGAHVQALDFSEGMLAQARAKLDQPNLTFVVADLTQRWPCADQSSDLIVGNLVLEHIAELGFIFSEVARVLTAGGRCFICELHPFRQYQGGQATFQDQHGTTKIPAYLHHISDYLEAAQQAGLALKDLKEWWHEADQNTVPRLVSFMFEQRRMPH